MLLFDAGRTLLPIKGKWFCLLLLLFLGCNEGFFSPFFSLFFSRDLEPDLVRDLERDLELCFLRRLSDRDVDLVEEDLVLFDFLDTPDLVDASGNLDCPTE